MKHKMHQNVYQGRHWWQICCHVSGVKSVCCIRNVSAGVYTQHMHIISYTVKLTSGNTFLVRVKNGYSWENFHEGCDGVKNHGNCKSFTKISVYVCNEW